MSDVTVGYSGLSQVGTERVFDPVSGAETFIIIEGSQASLETFAAQQQQYGRRVSVFPHEGPIYRARIQFNIAPLQGSVVGGADSWEFSHSNREVDIFSHPDVENSGVSDEDFTSYREAIENRQALPAGAPSIWETVKQQYDRGNTSYLLSHLVLRRRKVIPATFNQGSKFFGQGTVYSSAALVSTFSVPGSVANQIPDTSGLDTPSDASWGWFLMGQESNIVPAQNKHEEVLEWELAAWSTIWYTHIG